MLPPGALALNRDEALELLGQLESGVVVHLRSCRARGAAAIAAPIEPTGPARVHAKRFRRPNERSGRGSVR